MKHAVQGNRALCDGAIAGGLDAYYAYPITPQNEISAYFSQVLPERGKVFLQAESEIAAINMVFGSAVAGKRALTTSSSPGISLMQETISYLCACELPCVIANVMRGGPGLGNISGSQQDYFQSTRGGGHGDYRMLVLAPAGAVEIFTFARDAFALAEKYRNPVLIVYDGYLGQMLETVDGDPASLAGPPLPTEPPDRSWVLDGASAGRPPRKIRSLLMQEGDLEALNWRLHAKYERMASAEVRWEEISVEDAEIVLVAFGMAARVCTAACKRLRAEGVRAGLIRPITLWPFPEQAIARAAERVRRMLVVEMNLGQMVEDVRRVAAGRIPVDFHGRPGGSLVIEEDIVAAVRRSGAAS